MANETKVLTLGEIGMLPNKFLSKSYNEEDTFYVPVDASRFYYDYCYRPFETFNMDEIITSVNDYEFNGTISEFESKINAYKEKGYEIAIINLGFFNKVYYPNLKNTIIPDSNSKSRYSLNYVDMEKIWYVNLYYENWNGIITRDELQTFNPYFIPKSLIIYDIQNDTVFPWPLSADGYQTIITNPTTWDENDTKINVGDINRLIKRYIWACKSTSVVDKNFCPAINDEIRFDDWDLLCSVGTKRIIREYDTGFRGILSDIIPLETTSNTKCVTSGELGRYNNMTIVRTPQTLYTPKYEPDNLFPIVNTNIQFYDFDVATAIWIEYEDGMSDTTYLRTMGNGTDEKEMKDYSYDLLFANNTDSYIVGMNIEYSFGLNKYHYNTIPFYIESIDCEVYWRDEKFSILDSKYFSATYDESNPSEIIFSDSFSLTQTLENNLYKFSTVEFIININESNYIWFTAIGSPKTNSKNGYKLEMAFIQPNKECFHNFNTLDSKKTLPIITVMAHRNGGDEYGSYVYGIKKSDIEGKVLAIDFIENKYGTNGIALFDFYTSSPEIGKIYTIEDDADGFVLSDNLRLVNDVDNTSVIEIYVPFTESLYYNNNNKYYAVLGLNTKYIFQDGQNPPSWGDGPEELMTVISCGNKNVNKKWEWGELAGYGDWSFDDLINEGHILDYNESYHNRKAEIQIKYL